MKHRADPNHPFFDRFNKLVTSAKENNKKSIRKIAMESGVHPTMISLYMRREIMPSVKSLERMANYFGVTTDYLLGREEW